MLQQVREFISSPSVSDGAGPQLSSRYVKSRLSPRDSVDSSTPAPSRLAPGAVSADDLVAFGSPLTMSDHKASSSEPLERTTSSWQISAEYAKGAALLLHTCVQEWPVDIVVVIMSLAHLQVHGDQS